MKTNSIVKSILLAVGFLAVALIGSAQAQFVASANFDAGSGIFYGANASGTGGNYFNDFVVTNGGTSNSISNLTESDSTTPSDVGATLSDNVILQNYNGGTSPNALFGQFAYSGYNSGNPGAPGSIFNLTLSTLTSTHTYDLYLYTSGGAEFSNSFGSLTGTGGGDAGGAYNAGQDYVEFTGITGVTSLSTDIAYDPSTVDYVNGFTLVDLGPNAVPEPSATALMGLGALAFLFIRRRLILS